MSTANLSAHTPQSDFTVFDASMMARAFKLAEKGRYSTMPNPRVGCVIVNQSQHIVGEGFHIKAGTPHAEVHALQQAGNKAQGATVYVTLEPCAHTNRTGPCALALVKAKVQKVIVACIDPNPKVAGKGIQILKNAGIEVRVGLMQSVGDSLNQHFFFRMQHQRPFVTVKLAASIDGKTALANGESKWITSAQARQDVQRHRASVCAILTGADTVIADNPSMNVRANELPSNIAQGFAWRQGQPLRVVTDSKNRLNAQQYQMFNDHHPCLVYNCARNNSLVGESISQQQLEKVVREDDAYVNLHDLLNDLAQKHINHVWVEAGAALTGALFDENLVDELIVYQAPVLLGASAKALISCKGPDVLSKARRGYVTDVRVVGVDTKTTIRFEA